MSESTQMEPDARETNRWRFLRWLGAGVVVLMLAIQFVPYGRDHDNPPVTQAIQWDSPRTEELARAACFDCHSNETNWPWHTDIAPMSWLTQRDVDQGRSELNFSEEIREQDIDDAVDTIRDGEMPPFRYVIAHPDARLSEQEKQELIDGFVATFGIDDDE